MLDITHDLGIPSYVAISHSVENAMDFVEFGSGSHFDARIALLRSLTELNQFLSIGLVGLRDAAGGGNDGHRPWRLQDHPYLTPNGHPAVRPDFGSQFGMLDTREQVMACVNLVKRAGLDFLVLDQTRPDIEVPVARVIVPGLRHFYRRFAPGRLYDVPIKLGWLDRPVPESDLNPTLPQDLGHLRLARACEKERAAGSLSYPDGKASRSRYAGSARERRHCRRHRGLFLALGKFSAGAADARGESCVQVCRSPHLHP